MGKLVYGAGQEYDLDDRVLSHVKLAIVAKLRRHESFLLNWDVPVEQGSGRVSLWISREVPLAFQFSGSRPPRSTRSGWRRSCTPRSAPAAW
ncbi:hypothetical protein [Leifsonia xyli]|uniref:DUF7882 family protein n=1 Tax=Leifsonia xyli TaxID=1575 RepID=UPI003D66C279